MAEAIIGSIVSTIIGKLASFIGSQALTHVKDESNARKNLVIMARDLPIIRGVLKDAEEKQYTDPLMKLWLEDLKGVVYDIDDLLDEVDYDDLLRSVNKGHFFRKVRYYASTSKTVIFHSDLSHRIKDLRVKLDEIVRRKDKFGLTENRMEAGGGQRNNFNGWPIVNRTAIVGRDKAKEDIIRRVLALGDVRTPSVLPIIGMGGIGKTALAKLVYKDVHHQFDIKLWVCISDKFDEQKVLEDLIKDAGAGINASDCNIGQLVLELQRLLKEKKYFLVFDDVWVEDCARWQDLMSIFQNIGKAGSSILVTTRKEKVALITKTVAPYNLNKLSYDACWQMFKQLAFRDGEEQQYSNLTTIGKSIVAKCQGVPLSVKCLGSLLRSQREEQQWQKIAKMDSFNKLKEYVLVNQILKTSYDELDPNLKMCFAYLALMAKDIEYVSLHQTYIWSALGLLQPQDGREENEHEIEDFGATCLKELISASFLQEQKLDFNENIESCKLHDSLHDLAMGVLGEDLAIVTSGDLRVSEASRHIVWGYEGRPNALLKKEFPENLLKAKRARTFKFSYRMNTISRAFLEGILSHMIWLRILELQNSHFEELPKTIGNLKHLRLLNLSYNPILRKLPDEICELLKLQALYLSKCEKLEEIPRKLYRLVSLRYLGVTTCQRSFDGTQLHELPNLRDLRLLSCQGMLSLWNDSNVPVLDTLRRLVIYKCSRLTRLPNSMKHLSFLEMLVIHDCATLDLEAGDGLSGLYSLQTLMIIGLPRLKYLPPGIQSAAKSLRYLKIEDCRGLIKLPSCLKSFASLQRLLINGCPHLSGRYAKPSGVDYPLIRHIPIIWLNGHRLTS